MIEKDFEILPHTADLKIRVYGKNLEELFRNAVIGMFQSAEPKARDCVVKNNRLFCQQLPIRRSIKVRSSSIDMLLIDFLSEALALSDIHNEVYLDVSINAFDNDKVIDALLCGVVVDSFDIEIKAVTFHDLAIHQSNGLWQTDIVFDI